MGRQKSKSMIRGLKRFKQNLYHHLPFMLPLLIRKSNQNELNYLPLSQRNNVGFHNILVSSVIMRVIQRYEIRVFLSLRSSIPEKSLISLKKIYF